MARQLGAWINADGGSALIKPSIYSTQQHYDAVVNNDFYKPVLVKAGNSWYKFTPQPLKMTKGNTFDAVGTMPRDRWQQTIGRAGYSETQTFFTSADMVYGAVVGTTNDVTFLKKTSSNNYEVIGTFATVAPVPAVNYQSSMSPNGEFFFTSSSTSPFLAFFKRTGDTWAQLAAFTLPATGAQFTYISGLLKTVGAQWYDNSTVVLHQTNSANFPTNQNFYVYKYNPSTEIFEPQSTTGLYENLRWNANQAAYTPNKEYLVFPSASSPYLRFYKTTNGLDFTDLTSNISFFPPAQHYGASWDPSGTYLFSFINSNAYVFGVWKRTGDSLTFLSNCFSEIPTVALAGSRYDASWSPDGRYVAIPSSSSTTEPYLLWLYKRQGDYFERVGGTDGYGSFTYSDTGLTTTLFASGSQFGFSWLR